MKTIQAKNLIDANVDVASVKDLGKDIIPTAVIYRAIELAETEIAAKAIEKCELILHALAELGKIDQTTKERLLVHFQNMLDF